jgi:DeoR family transcriptional regulator, fructose operon transcriptional repressor
VHAEERQHRLVVRARAEGRVDVASMAAELTVAPETVRRDLKVLEKRGLLQRVHGGAYPIENAGFETSLASRLTAHVAEKRRIAAVAAEQLGDAESVFVDEGFTPQLIAEALPRDRPLTLLTASVPVATSLATAPNMTVLLLGGRVRGRTLATVGPWTARMLAGFVVDLAFIGANGISRDHGLTTPDPAVAEVKSQAIRSAHRRILIGVHTKFGISSFCRFAEISDFELIITDTGVSASEAHRYSMLGPQVIRA